MSRLGEKGVKIQKNWSLMVSFVRLCASTEPTTQTRKVRHQNTLWERMRAYRLISQTPAVFAACPVFLIERKSYKCLKESVWIQNDDLERKRERWWCWETSFKRAFYFTQSSSSLFARLFRRAKRMILKQQHDKPSYLSPYAHRPDHSLSLSLSLSL